MAQLRWRWRNQENFLRLFIFKNVANPSFIALLTSILYFVHVEKDKMPATEGNSLLYILVMISITCSLNFWRLHHRQQLNQFKFPLWWPKTWENVSHLNDLALRLFHKGWVRMRNFLHCDWFHITTIQNYHLSIYDANRTLFAVTLNYYSWERQVHVSLSDFHFISSTRACSICDVSSLFVIIAPDSIVFWWGKVESEIDKIRAESCSKRSPELRALEKNGVIKPCEIYRFITFYAFHFSNKISLT